MDSGTTKIKKGAASHRRPALELKERFGTATQILEHAVFDHEFTGIARLPFVGTPVVNGCFKYADLIVPKTVHPARIQNGPSREAIDDRVLDEVPAFSDTRNPKAIPLVSGLRGPVACELITDLPAGNQHDRGGRRPLRNQRCSC